MNGPLKLAFVICGFTAIVGCSTGSQPKPDPFGYRQLTRDGGETGSPSLSRDGKRIAYASDRDSPDNLEIWVQDVERGNATRLTDDPARDYDPVFSADGETVFFTSLREPQGIYRVPAAGGKAELIVKGATSAQASPDGESLLFADESGHLAVFRFADGSSRELLKGFFNSYAPGWSPDGKEILFAGRAMQDDALEWWVADAAGQAPVNTGILRQLGQAGFTDAFAQAWLPGDEILFAGKQGDRITLWRVKLTADRRGLATKAVRATDDGEGDFRASYNGGHLVFARTKGTQNLWSVPVDTNQGRLTGLPERITFTDAQKGSSSVSWDGRWLLYSAQQDGTFRLQLKDLIRHTETTLPSENAFYGVLNAAGSRYLYGGGIPGFIDVSGRAVSGWRSWWTQSICQRCGMPRGLSRDGKWLLTWADTDKHVDLVNLDNGKPQRALESLSDHFYGPELSPSGEWISFVTKVDEHLFRTYIAHVPAAGSVRESDWIPITAPSDEYRMAFWSPDESTLYLLTEHGEGNLTWLEAQKLDSQKHPAGQPLSLYHFKSPRVPGMDPIWNHPAAVQGRIVLQLVDLSTNVWMMNAPSSSKF